MNPGTFRFLDLSGFIVSGKQAYSDLLRELEGFRVPAAEEEFELIRIQGGIRDLENALVTDWSPLRADAAMRAFQRCVHRLGTRASIGSPTSWFKGAGWNYDAYFSERFFELAAAYVRSLTKDSWRTNWPYPLVDACDHELFFRKCLSKAGVSRAMDFRICLAGAEGFLEHTRQFLETLLATRALAETRTIVMHNAFEPFNPLRAIRYFTRAQCIVIDRDPRDSFVAMSPHRHLALPVSLFISRFKAYRQQVQIQPSEAGLVLRTRFEDLVLDYDATLLKVLGFLGEEPRIHVRKRQFFEPSRSARNVGIWKKHASREDIERIHAELREYCDPRAD